MAAAAATINAYAAKLDDTAWKEERVNVTVAATGDWYDCVEITTIVGAMISANFVIAAADAFDCAWATNRVTINTIAGGTTGTYELIIWGI